MRLKFKHWKEVSLLVLVSIVMLSLILFGRAAGGMKEVDINDFFKNLDAGSYEVPKHSHKYTQVYDETSHWYVCSICGTIKDGTKNPHNLTVNGSWYVCMPSDSNKFAAKRGCICGYESKPIIVVHGRLEDYNNKDACISNSGVDFNSIEKISYAEFKAHYLNAHGTKNGIYDVKYTFGNFEKGSNGNYIDSDLGYVFSGGPIGSGPNKRGTLGRLGIPASSNDYPELRTLVKFFQKFPNGTKEDFIKLLNTPYTTKVTIGDESVNGYIYNDITNSNNALYGLKTKYESLDNGKFNKLREELLGYTEHISSAGWRSDFIFCNHTNSDIPSGKGCHASSGDYVGYYWNHGCRRLGAGMDTNSNSVTYCDMCGGDYPAYSCEQFQGLMIDLTKAEAGQTYNTAWNLANGQGQLKGKYTVHSISPELKVTLTVDLNGTGYQIWDVPVNTWTMNKDNNTITMTKSENTPGYNWQNTSMSWGWFSSDIKCISPHWGAPGKANNAYAVLRFGIYYPYADKAAPNKTKLDITYPSDGLKLPNVCLLDVAFTDNDDSRSNFVIYNVYQDEKCTRLIKGLDSNGNAIDTFTMVKSGGSGSNDTLGKTAIYTSKVSLLLEASKDTIIYVKAKDKAGNVSNPIPVKINAVDSISPQVESRISPDGWQRSKTITYKIYDLFGEQEAGITSSSFDWKDVSFNNDVFGGTSSIYDNKDKSGSTRKYVIKGNIGAEGRELIFYALDANGNLTSNKMYVSKIDNTEPVINSIDVVDLNDDELKIKVNTSDKMTVYRDKEHQDEVVDGSGVIGYIITSENKQPSETDDWSTSDELVIKTNGTYYIWCKDAVSNISSCRILEINHFKENSTDVGTALNDPNKEENYEKVNDINVLKDSKKVDEAYYHNTSTLNQTYNHKYIGYLRYDYDGAANNIHNKGFKLINVDNQTTVNIYYRRIRYFIQYNGNTSTNESSLNVGDTTCKYDLPFNIPQNEFEKVYTYKVDLNGGVVVENKGYDYNKNSGTITETWTFKDWLFDNDAQRDDELATKHYKDKERIEKPISVRDNNKITLKAQWNKGSIKLPVIKRDGCDFVGWFNVPQYEALDSSRTIYRIGDGGETVTIEGSLRGVYTEDEEKNNSMTLYAWYDRKPVFINMYDGLFFEGQKVSYTDLLSMIDIWDYDKDVKVAVEKEIDKYFKTLRVNIDDEINDLRSDIKYLVEDKKDAEDDGEDTSSYTEEITELQKQLKRLLAERDKINEAHREAKEKLKELELIPTIAKIEYLGSSDEVATPSNATPLASKHEHTDKHIDDYHTLDEATNGIKRVEVKSKDEYDSLFLDTCSNSIGQVKVTYQVYNKPIEYIWQEFTDEEEDGDLEDDINDDIEKNLVAIENTEIAIEYTRTYQINFNYNPLLRLQNMIYYSHTNFVSNGELGKFVESRQALYDPEDLQDNLPWWSESDSEEKKNKLLHDENANTKDELQRTIEVVGISNITFDSAYEDKHRGVVEQFKQDYEKSIKDGSSHDDLLKLLDDIYALKNSTDEKEKELFGAIRTIGLTFDGYDQFGKYASNKLSDSAVDMGVYTDKRPLGYNEKFNGGYKVEYAEEYDTLIYQIDSERTVNLILVNTETDSVLIKNRVFDRIRYVNLDYVEKLSEKSYWGVKKNNDRLKDILEKGKTGGTSYQGTYKDKKGKEVKIKVNDYSN